MPIMPSKLVLARQKSAQDVVAVREQAPAVGKALAARHPEAQRQKLEAAVALLVDAETNRLDAALRAMVTADDAHRKELGDDAGPRGRRDAASESVRESLVRLRTVLGACFGDGVLKSFGIEGLTPDDPVAVHRVADFALRALRGFTAPATLVPSLKFVPSDWIALLDKPVKELAAALADVATEERQAQLTQTAAAAATEAYDATFREVANLLEGLFTAAGRKDLAERVRPSTRRPGMTAVDAPQPVTEPAQPTG